MTVKPLFLGPVELLGPERRRRKPVRRNPVEAVMAMVELRDHMRGAGVLRAQQVAEDKAEAKDKTVAFVLFVLMTAILGGLMWAGVHG